eukprot:scaffold1493_cov172-Ochromonas_danica.AAC.13
MTLRGGESEFDCDGVTEWEGIGQRTEWERDTDTQRECERREREREHNTVGKAEVGACVATFFPPSETEGSHGRKLEVGYSKVWLFDFLLMEKSRTVKFRFPNIC